MSSMLQTMLKTYDFVRLELTTKYKLKTCDFVGSEFKHSPQNISSRNTSYPVLLDTMRYKRKHSTISITLKKKV